MTWAETLAAVVQVDPVTTQSAISVGLMITIIGAVAWLSRVLTRSEMELRSINEKLGELKTLPGRMSLLEQEVGHVRDHVTTLEADVNNLWTAVREATDDGDLLDRTRRERGPRLRDEHNR